MNIKEMHYEFKLKLNKLDSQQNRNLLIPEIDWLLNEAQIIFIKKIAEPRVSQYLGFETSQRNTDDIRTLVKSESLNVVSDIVSLPSDYMYHIRSVVNMSRGRCKNIPARVYIQQHDDMFEESPFDKSSFEWRHVNGVFDKDGMRLFNDGTFSNDSVTMTYIKVPVYMHNAEDFNQAGYKMPGRGVLTGSVNCELPEHTHSEIVDIAVMLASSSIGMQDYQLKMQKLAFNQIQ